MLEGCDMLDLVCLDGLEAVAGEAAWNAAMKELSTRSYRIVPVAMEDQCLTIVVNIEGRPVAGRPSSSIWRVWSDSG